MFCYDTSGKDKEFCVHFKCNNSLGVIRVVLLLNSKYVVTDKINPF